MRSPSESRAVLESCFDELEALMGDLSEAEWAAPSLCPDWAVRDVVAHLGSIEHLLLGWMPSSADDPLPFEKAGAYLDEVRELAGAPLAQRTRELLDARRAELRALSDAQFTGPSPSPVGPTTYQDFMEVRSFDFWVHQQDITVPLGRPADRSGPGARLSLERMTKALGFVVGKNIGAPDGSSIVFELTGPIETSIAVVVDGRAAVVDQVDDPDVVLTADSTTFLLLGAGRLDPEATIADGRVTWRGDADLGGRAARGLRFVTF